MLLVITKFCTCVRQDRATWPKVQDTVNDNRRVSRLPVVHGKQFCGFSDQRYRVSGCQHENPNLTPSSRRRSCRRPVDFDNNNDNDNRKCGSPNGKTTVKRKMFVVFRIIRTHDGNSNDTYHVVHRVTQSQDYSLYLYKLL